MWSSNLMTRLGRSVRLGIALLLGLCLAACGFTLKGAVQGLPVQELQMQVQANSYIAPALQQALLLRRVALNTQVNAAVPRLGITAENRERNVLTTNTNGRVREYQLKHTLTVQVWDGQGRVWLPPVTFSQSRDMSYDENKVLAKETEELSLYKDMQSELVSAIMRRLEALRTVPAPK